MRCANRLFELIQILRRVRTTLTAAQLAKRLEVMPRAVFCDMAL